MEDMGFTEAVESMKSGELVLVKNGAVGIDCIYLCIYLYGISDFNRSSKNIKITRHKIGLNHEGQEIVDATPLTSDEIVDMLNERFVIASTRESYIAKFRDMHRTAMYTLNLLTHHVVATPHDMRVDMGCLIGMSLLNITTDNN